MIDRSALKQIIKKLCPSVLRAPARAVLRKTRSFRQKLIQKRKKIRFKADAIFFPGKMRVTCPCCGFKFRSFIDGGYRNNPGFFNPKRYEHTRQDVICPNCHSLPRHRFLALWFEEHFSYIRSAEILYFAPAKCEALWMKRRGVRCTTADLYTHADLQLDIQDTRLPDQSYDIIIANHVLEHVDDFRLALLEMHRILRINGSFICSFPMDPAIELVDEETEALTEKERWARFGQRDHKRVFGLYPDCFFANAGFTVERIEGKNYPDSILPIVGPADYDMNILFWCNKIEE